MPPPKNWVKEIHLKQLVEKLESKKPCAPVFLSFSSHVPRKPSTVGKEAAHLIQLYRNGNYRSGMKSEFDLDVKEIKLWYKNITT